IAVAGERPPVPLVPLVAEAAVGFDVDELGAGRVDGHCASSITCTSSRVKLRRPVVASTVPVALPHSLLPGVSTDLRTRAAYAEGAGVYRILPAAVTVPRGVEELQRVVRWAAESGVPLVPRGEGACETGSRGSRSSAPTGRRGESSGERGAGSGSFCPPTNGGSLRRASRRLEKTRRGTRLIGSPRLATSSTCSSGQRGHWPSS